MADQSAPEGFLPPAPAPSEAPVVLTEQTLPEVKLRESIVSPLPINVTKEPKGMYGNEMVDKSHSMQDIRALGNYTIALMDEVDQVKLFDSQGRPVEEFNQLGISKRRGNIDYAFIRQHMSGKSYLAPLSTCKKYPPGMPRNAYTAYVDTLPAEIQPFANRLATIRKIPGFDQVEINDNLFKAEEINFTDSPQMRVLLNGKYVVFIKNDKQDILRIVYTTQDEHGVPQLPRNWKGALHLNDQNLPADLKAEIGFETPSTVNSITVANKYGIRVSATGLEILNLNDPARTVMRQDTISNIRNNICIDPHNPSVIYYTRGDSSHEITRMDLSGDPKNWQPVIAEIPEQHNISHLQLDPTGNFFAFDTSNGVVLMDKESLQISKDLPGFKHVHFDASGKMRAVNKEGKLVIFEDNFQQIATEATKNRLIRMSQNIKIDDLFEDKASGPKKSAEVQRSFDHLEPVRIQYATQFQPLIDQIQNFDDITRVGGAVVRLGTQLRNQGVSHEEANYITDGLIREIGAKQKAIVGNMATDTFSRVRGIMGGGGLSLIGISDAKVELEHISGFEGQLDEVSRRELRDLKDEVTKQSAEVFKREGSVVIQDVQGIVDRVRMQLEGMTSRGDFEDWAEFSLPQLKSRLGELARNVPLEAADAFKAITGAQTELRTLSDEFEKRFKEQYDKVREQAADRMATITGVIRTDIDGIVGRLQGKGFKSRDEAEIYMSSSAARAALEEQIAGLESQDPDAARELMRTLRVRLSNALTEIELGSSTEIAKTGQQMVRFGETLFPKWEARVKEEGQKRVELAFIADERSKGASVGAGQIMGDVGILVTSSDGQKERMRLWEDTGEREDNYRYGNEPQAIQESYVSKKQYDGLVMKSRDWNRGEESVLRHQLSTKQEELKALNEQIKAAKVASPDGSAEEERLRELRRPLLDEYVKFYLDNNVATLKHLDKIKSAPEEQHVNGKGYVPEWQNHWVMDSHTDYYLEEMAKDFKMQLDLQEGILDLKGHAGTGKDVLIKMFCERTKRPYFAIDCSKWTTEFELSEDVTLEAVDGASQTVKVPSVVLNAITTPGAMMYFNEINAMPEQAQIFLHGLLDEKRTLTLKTRSGKSVKADPSVLLACSRNPGYFGTFEPQFATKSRFMSLDVEYPPLQREKEAGDPNPNPPYDASEALRIARGIDSLADLTIEATMERNEFVQMWDKYVNGIDNGAADPTPLQKFDIDVTVALLQYGSKLRRDFILQFEKSREARNALPVHQPLTGREFRRCAYGLSQIAPEDKFKGDPESTARALLGKFFLSHIDNSEDRTKIETAMKTWSSQKRVAA